MNIMNEMYFLTLILTILFLIIPTTHQSVDFPKARLYIEAFLRDLEIITDPPLGTKSQYEPSEFPKIRELFLDNLIKEVNRSQESLEMSETISIFNKMLELYSLINLNGSTTNTNGAPALSLSKALSYGAPCKPLYQFPIAVEEVVLDSFQPDDFYPQVHEWLDRSSSDPDFAVCDTHLGLVCTQQDSALAEDGDDSRLPFKCSCQPNTKWISPPGKCLLSPDSPCTFLNIHLQTDNFPNLPDPLWFLSRVFTFPVVSPTCGEGLVCDSVRDRLSLTPICLCTDNSSRNGECKDKSTWTESESLAHKISKLIIDTYDPCTPPEPETELILQTLSGNGQEISPEKAEELKTTLVENGELFCDYENFEWCSKDHKICLRACPLHGQTHDPLDEFKCKFNYGEKCPGREPFECITLATCVKLDWSKDYTCLCKNTIDTANFTIRDYHYGPKCALKSKSFWLRLFQPFTSGISGDEFIKKERELDKKLKVIEDLTILEINSTCDFDKEYLALNTLSYFGNNFVLEEYLYEDGLKRLLEYEKSDLLCHHKNFLTCNDKTNSCQPFDDRFFWDNETRTLHYGEGQNCIKPVPSTIPKVFYHPYSITCSPNSFCVIDLSKEHPILSAGGERNEDDLNATCHCPRNATGLYCQEPIKEIRPYNALEKARLQQLMQMIQSKSSLKYGSNCSLRVENSLDDVETLKQGNLEDIDLYHLYYTLSQVLNRKEQFHKRAPDLFIFEIEFGLCSKQESLQCISSSSLSESSEEDPEDEEGICDCRREFEWKLGKCYISDGKPCRKPEYEGYNISCASGKCSRTSSGRYVCEEDFTYRFVVPFSDSSSAGSYNLNILSILTAVMITLGHF